MHITHDRLIEFAAGRLAGDEWERVASHIEACAECGGRLDEIELHDDPLVGMLRQSDAWRQDRQRMEPGDTDEPEVADRTSPPNLVSASRSSDSPNLHSVPSRDQRPLVQSVAFHPRCGDSFGRYELHEEIGRGGMGVVYRAFDPALRRFVAIKLMAPQRFAREDERLRFRREAEAAARLQHANIVQIFEHGDLEGTLYCVFELVEGGSLRDRFARGDFDQARAVDALAVVAEAVDYAHRRHVVHRDLKPDNILFSLDETPKIADFGLAKRLDDDIRHTTDGTLLGSPAYMSPEQAAGDTNAIDPRTDVYSLGAILYEALVGEPPFTGGSVLDLLDRVRRRPPRPPSELRPATPRDLETICLKCLEKVPSQRYATAAEFAADLVRFRCGLPVSARRPSIGETAARLVRRHPRAAAFAAAFLAVVFGFTAVTWRLNLSLSGSNKQLTDALEESDRRWQELRHTAYSLQLQQAAELSAGDPEHAALLLYDTSLCPAELRDFSWRWIEQQTRRKANQWTMNDEPLVLSVSPSGKWMAIGGRSGELAIISTDGRTKPHRRSCHDAPITDIAIAVDERRIAIASENGSTRVISVDLNLGSSSRREPESEMKSNGEPTAGSGPPSSSADGPASKSPIDDWAVIVDDDAPSPFSANAEDVMLMSGAERVNGAVFTADGQFLATAESDGVIRVWDIADKTIVRELGQMESSVISVAISAQGKHLAAMARDGEVRLWDAETWNPVASVVSHRTLGVEVQFHPTDDSVIATIGGDRVLRLWRLHGDSLKLLQAVAGFDDLPRSISFSSDGAQIAAGNYDPIAVVVDTRTGENRLTLRNLDGVNQVAFATQGRLFTAVRSNEIAEWHVAPQDRAFRFPAHDGGVAALAWLPKNGMLATSGFDGAVRIWRLTGSTHQLVRQWRVEDQWITHLAASADGSRLAWEAGGELFVADVNEDLPEETSELRAKSLGGEPLFVNDLRFARSLRHLVVADLSGLLQVDCKTGARQRLDNGADIRRIAVLADGAAAGRADGEWRMTLSRNDAFVDGRKLNDSISCLAASADSEKLVVGATSGEAILCDARSGELIHSLVGHAAAVVAASYSPDGKTLATADEDGDVHLWDARFGFARGEFNAGSDVAAMSFSPDGNSIACGSGDGQVRLWTLPPLADEDNSRPPTHGDSIGR